LGRDAPRRRAAWHGGGWGECERAGGLAQDAHVGCGRACPRSPSEGPRSPRPASGGARSAGATPCAAAPRRGGGYLASACEGPDELGPDAPRRRAAWHVGGWRECERAGGLAPNAHLGCGPACPRSPSGGPRSPRPASGGARSAGATPCAAAPREGGGYLASACEGPDELGPDAPRRRAAWHVGGGRACERLRSGPPRLHPAGGRGRSIWQRPKPMVGSWRA